MAEEESPKVKVELEVPREMISIESAESKSEEESSVKEITGYEPAEIIKAVATPPEPEVKPHKELRRPQLRNMLLGFAMVIVGLLLWPFVGFGIAITVALLGALFIAFGALIRL